MQTKKNFFSFRQAYYNLTVRDQQELRTFMKAKKGWCQECSFYRLLDNVTKIDDYETISKWFEEQGFERESVWAKNEA